MAQHSWNHYGRPHRLYEAGDPPRLQEVLGSLPVDPWWPYSPPQYRNLIARQMAERRAQLKAAGEKLVDI